MNCRKHKFQATTKSPNRYYTVKYANYGIIQYDTITYIQSLQLGSLVRDQLRRRLRYRNVHTYLQTLRGYHADLFKQESDS